MVTVVICIEKMTGSPAISAKLALAGKRFLFNNVQRSRHVRGDGVD